MRVRPYQEIPGLDVLYLEDSWVLDVSESEAELRFELEAVLTEAHPNWSPPKEGEQYAYRRVGLVFPQPNRVHWLDKTMRPNSYLDGTVDYGNIDTFVWGPGQYELSGSWGHVQIESEPPTVVES